MRDKAAALFFRLSQAQNQASKYPITQVITKHQEFTNELLFISKCVLFSSRFS